MADDPDFDAFLADPCGVWTEHAPAIPQDWAIQAARSSRAFREQLKGEVAASIETTGAFDDADRAVAVLATVLDAQDIAGLFSELAKRRPAATWAAAFAKRFARS